MTRKTPFPYAQALLNARRELGLNQTDLAKRTGVKCSRLSEIENGHVANPHKKTLAKIEVVTGNLSKHVNIEIESKLPEFLSQHSPNCDPLRHPCPTCQAWALLERHGIAREIRKLLLKSNKA